MSNQNKAVIERLTRELFNEGGDLDVVFELLSPDFVDRTPPSTGRSDREGFRQRGVKLRATFSDVRTTSEQLVAEGDFVCERYSCSFRHTAEYHGVAPTGRPLRLSGFAMYRLEKGQVVESWSLSSGLTLLSQLGLVAPTMLDGQQLQ